ncbi:hypothetical protein OSB04_001645 [Centaurea solstitialis]|uniref:Jacalin-type lectin domain-containing protein n=1 Tax=Centaurea solstitialis TaxID=347529 RepID=A0AA38TRQ8_9ASTR|nr:hypothetical protein OSB04_001645 [Centaurea solstitialis]
MASNAAVTRWRCEPPDLDKFTTLYISFSGNKIYSIQFSYDNQAASLYDPSQFLLDKDERITLISGTRSGTLAVTSLTFETNKGNTYTYGDGGGRVFKVQVDGKIIGFHGSYEEYLTALDASNAAVTRWRCEPPDLDKFTTLYISFSGNKIYSIQFSYDNQAGKEKDSPSYGVTGGNKNSFLLDKDERITLISGTRSGTLAVTSLTFETNKGNTYTYGDGGGRVFKVQVDGKIIGFHGSYEEYLTALDASNAAVTRWRCEPPDLDKFTTLYISFSGNKIYSIQFSYDNQAGKEKDSPSYGVTGGNKNSFLLDKDERITLISGTRSGTLAVTSLTFETNKGNTYTYGDGGGRVFKVQVDGKIIGFHGSYEEYLTALDASNAAVTRWRCEPPDLDKFTTLYISFSGNKIYSIQFSYDNQAGKEKDSPSYGVTGGNKNSFLLDKDERITLISGTRSGTLAVTSLTFETNKGNTYTYGDGGGRVFKVQVDGKIIGFHGSYEEYLTALDASNAAVTRWRCEPPDLDKFTTLYISFSGNKIYSIQFSYDNQAGKEKDSPSYGVTGGNKNSFLLDKDERITLISGTRSGTLAVTSLTFETNKGNTYTYGDGGGRVFKVQVDGKIIGFHGSYEEYLTALDASNAAVTRWRCEPPDLDKFTTLYISFSGNKIYSIQFSYDNQAGKEKDSPSYGVTGGNKNSFLLDKDERITLISGTRSGTLAVTSLTFETNKGNTYTYGDGGGRVFKVQVDGKIIGFHGSYEEYLTALDVIV